MNNKGNTVTIQQSIPDYTEYLANTNSFSIFNSDPTSRFQKKNIKRGKVSTKTNKLASSNFIWPTNNSQKCYTSETSRS